MKKNEWLVLELRMCRTASGLSHRELSEITGVAIQSIKRMERKEAHPRCLTINIIRMRRVMLTFFYLVS